MTFLEEIENHPLCGDGAMGTLLMERGIPAEQCFEELCVAQPALILGIHADYLAAGARILRTNSFGANAVRLARHGLEGRVNEINWQAAQIAKEAAKGTGAYVAGSVGPLGISAGEASERMIDREKSFRTHIGALLDGGVNLIFLETFQDLDELLLALRVKQSLHHCPAVCSLAVRDDGTLPDGTSLEAAFAKLVQNEADILGFNGSTDPQAALDVMRRALPKEPPLAVFPKAGTTQNSPTADFAEKGLQIIAAGARIIGGCCGTTPAHIAAMAKLLAETR